MISNLGRVLKEFWGPARLLQSNAILIVLSLFSGFFLSWKILPKTFRFLPSDRGREFTLTKEAAKGKPTGSGVVFITLFVVLCFIIIPLDFYEGILVLLTWVMMLTGFLDDRSSAGWGEYLKAFLDFVIAVAASFVIRKILCENSPDGRIWFWLPFRSAPVHVADWFFMVLSVVLLWASVNTTNCTDGVDGLSSSLVLIGLITLGVSFYTVFGHKDISAYLLINHIASGSNWAIMCFLLTGILSGYLWHNAFPSSVLMGDAGSRALGFFTGVCVILTGNPFMFLATSSIIFINGGLGLLKVALKRFFHISILTDIRFPLHDHMRKNLGWSPTQVLVKFVLVQVMITVAVLGVFLKIR